MSKGLNGLKQVGIPTDSLNPAALAGTALNAAKSLTATVDWAKGLPIPSDLKGQFDKVARDGAFAVDFANQKVNNALKQEIVPEPASDTVNRETVNAAASRVVGNAKVPAVSYDNAPKVDIVKFGNAVNAASQEFLDLNDDLQKTGRRLIIEPPSVRLRISEQKLGDYNALDSKLLGFLREAKLVEAEIGSVPPQLAIVESLRANVAKILAALKNTIDQLKQRIENSAT
jgi:hypothetical protein